MDANLKVSQVVCIIVRQLIRIQGMVCLDFVVEFVVFRLVCTNGVVSDDIAFVQLLGSGRSPMAPFVTGFESFFYCWAKWKVKLLAGRLDGNGASCVTWYYFF